MKRIIPTILAACLLTVLPQPAEAQGDSIARYTTEHPLIYEDAWDLWPYVFLNENGDPDGYNIDLLKLIFKELDIPFIIKLKPTLDAQADLKSGKSDLMLRMDAEYSRGNSLYGKSIVHLFTQSIVMPKDISAKIEKGQDLARYKVIVHDGSLSHHQLKKYGWAREFKAYDDMKKAIKDVSSANKGIIVWNTMSLKWLMRKYHTDSLVIQPVDLPYGEYKFMSKDHRLLEQIDSVYAILRASDRLQPIQNKWFYPDRKETGIPSWIWETAAIMSAIALFIFIYYLTYRRREHQMMKVVQKSNDRLSLVLKTSRVSLWTYDMQTRTFTWMDEHGKPLHNSPTEEFALRYRPEDVVRLRHALEDIARQKAKTASINVKATDELKEGHDYTISLSVLRSDKNGRPLTILGTRSDITGELLRQMKVKETRLRYQAIFQTTMINMVYYDKDGIITDMNQRAIAAFGTGIEDIRAMKISIKDVTGFDIDLDKDFDYIYLTQIYNGDDDDDRIVARHLKKKMYYELQVTAIRDVEGNLTSIIGCGHDVSELVNSYKQQKQYIQELQKSNDEITTYIRSIDYALSASGIRLIEYHPDTHQLLVFNKADRVGQPLTQTRILNLTDRRSKRKVERILNSMDNLTDTSTLTDVRTILTTKDDQPLYLQFHLIPNHDEQGKVTNYIGMFRDISELKALEEKLAKETLRAQEVEVVKNAFLHNMCFEIRTPLNTVVGFAELFQMEHTEEDEIVFIDEIKENSSRLLRLINDILFLSRLDADMITMNRRPVDFAAVVMPRCEASWGSDRQPGVEYIVKNTFSKLVVEIDESNLNIILEKIITNAVQHTAQGQVLVRYDYLGDELIVAVDDTGEGIPEEILEHIFERFVTGDSNISRAGLGLSICHDLIQHLGGTINIKSTLGKGTSVWFAIPCKALEIERL